MSVQQTSSMQTAPQIPGVQYVDHQAQSNHLHDLYHSWKELLAMPITSTSARITAGIALLRNAIAGRHLVPLDSNTYLQVKRGYWLQLLFYGQQAIKA